MSRLDRLVIAWAVVNQIAVFALIVAVIDPFFSARPHQLHLWLLLAFLIPAQSVLVAGVLDARWPGWATWMTLKRGAE